MLSFDKIRPGGLIDSLTGPGAVTVRHALRLGDSALEVAWRDAHGAFGERILFPGGLSAAKASTAGRSWSLGADGTLFQLPLQGQHVRLAHLFGPSLAISTSSIGPMPYQITVVYGEMPRCQPLRFLLAGDPGASKTIMAGLPSRS